MIALRDPLRDTTAFLVFAQGVALGCVVIAAVSRIDFQRASFRDFVGIPLALALMLSALLVLFGSGPGSSDAKVNLLGVQPVEAIRLLVVFSLAAYFARRWEMLRELSEKRGEGQFLRRGCRRKSRRGWRGRWRPAACRCSSISGRSRSA